MTWVGHKEVARRDIKGTWKRFTYFCRGVNVHPRHWTKCYIYCESSKTFITLFANWCRQAQDLYIYTLMDPDGVDISLQDIIMDRPEVSPAVQRFLSTVNTGSTYNEKCFLYPYHQQGSVHCLCRNGRHGDRYHLCIRILSYSEQQSHSSVR
jgi:hypothetical protein